MIVLHQACGIDCQLTSSWYRQSRPGKRIAGLKQTPTSQIAWWTSSLDQTYVISDLQLHHVFFTVFLGATLFQILRWRLLLTVLDDIGDLCLFTHLQAKGQTIGSAAGMFILRYGSKTDRLIHRSNRQDAMS